MEITLQGSSIYGIQDWDGKVDVEGLKLFQLKRLTGSRDTASLFRKLIKIFKGEHSPIKLPAGINPEDLDMGDFTQIMIAITASSKGRSVRKVYECPHCKAEQARVIDILKVFTPSKPEIEGGKAEVAAGITCHNLRVKEYIKIYDTIDSMRNSVSKSVGGKQVLDFTGIKAEYGDIADFQDVEDLDDFCSVFLDVGMIASRVVSQSIAEENRFKDTLTWLWNMQGEQLELYKKISETAMKLSADVSNTYESQCTSCKKKFTAELDPADYFFDLQYPS